MNVYLDTEEEAFVKAQEKGFLRALVRIAMNDGEVPAAIEPLNLTGMEWLTCTPAMSAKMHDFYVACMLPKAKK